MLYIVSYLSHYSTSYENVIEHECIQPNAMALLLHHHYDQTVSVVLIHELYIYGLFWIVMIIICCVIMTSETAVDMWPAIYRG